MGGMHEDEVPVNPLREARYATPHEVGVLSVPVSSRTANRGRWYYQDQWSAWTKRRVIKHLEQFTTHEEFVEFAIEAARIRHLPPPNYKKSTPASEWWSVTRIVHALERLLAGRTLGSNSLQFFNAALDELEGFQWGGTATTVLTNGEEVDEIVAVVEHMAGDGYDADEDDGRSEELTDLRRRYVVMLIVKAEEHDGIPPDDLLDRIERLL